MNKREGMKQNSQRLFLMFSMIYALNKMLKLARDTANQW